MPGGHIRAAHLDFPRISARNNFFAQAQCTAFPYFIGDILELPLTDMQDYSLFCIL
jgi:hypothetical protein